MLLIACFALFSYLSYWQYQRGQEKSLLAKKITNLTSHQAKPLAKYLKDVEYNDDLRFEAVTLTGKFLLPNILLENQFHNHQWGFRIFSPFQLIDTNSIILVDRGWYGAISRNNLPTITTVNNELTITGYINFPSQGMELGENNLSAQQDKIIQITHVNFKKLNGYFQQQLLPFNVTLFNRMTTDEFLIPPPKLNMLPAKHYGYSLQWFALAIVTLIYCFLRCKY